MLFSLHVFLIYCEKPIHSTASARHYWRWRTSESSH